MSVQLYLFCAFCFHFLRSASASFCFSRSPLYYFWCSSFVLMPRVMSGTWGLQLSDSFTYVRDSDSSFFKKSVSLSLSLTFLVISIRWFSFYTIIVRSAYTLFLSLSRLFVNPCVLRHQFITMKVCFINFDSSIFPWEFFEDDF